MPDLDHPLEAYEGLRRAHSRRVAEFFEDLVRRSGVDEAENRRLVAQIGALGESIGKAATRRTMWRTAMFAGIALAVVLAGLAWFQRGSSYLLLAPAAGALLLTVTKVRDELSRAGSQLGRLAEQQRAKQNAAWAQLEPLNRLHAWGDAASLFEATLPALQFDPYLSSSRLADLASTYGLSPDLGPQESSTFVQGGEINDNPLVFHRSLRHLMGMRTYTGSIVIHWSEQVRRAEGNSVPVNRSQTLTASVTRPCPEYLSQTRLLYGHEAAPALSFSRKPSGLAGQDTGVVNTLRKNHRIKRVERQARRSLMSGAGKLTVMNNREFEVLFGATNRDDEQGFRFLFTPLAQAEMVKLLNDRALGFGEDFTFTKRGGLNTISARHLERAQLEAPPALFHTWDLAVARTYFNHFHARYFRSVYFALAPLLAIPSYRERRSVPKRAGDPGISQWEHEVLAHHLGESAFAHPQSVTRNILKPEPAIEIEPGVQQVDVVAHGYGSVPRVEYVPVRGGDGRTHNVPVHWAEYYWTRNRRTMLVATAPGSDLEEFWNGVLARHGYGMGDFVVRGPLTACLIRN